MSYLENNYITQEGPKKAFLGRVQKTIQEVKHREFGRCYRVWFKGQSEPILFTLLGTDSAIEVGILPLSYPGSSLKDKKLIRWAIDRYTTQGQLELDDEVPQS